MTLSVIIVNWNAKRYLLGCLQSIFRQCPPDTIEVIVVDNGSSDGSQEAVAACYPAVRVIENGRNFGFARANNIGIRASRGEYLFLINSDVVVPDGCFDSLLRFIDQHRDIGILGPKIVGPDGTVQRSCMRYPSLWNTLCRALALDSLFPRSPLFGSHLLTFWKHDETRAVEVINGCFWLLRRAAVEQVGLLDERFFIYGEDVDWCKRFNEGGWKVVFFAGAEALHYGGGSSANAPVAFDVEMQRANYQYWAKHHSRVASGAFLMISLLHHGVRVIGEVAGYPLRRVRGASAYKIRRAIASIKWIVNQSERAA